MPYMGEFHFTALRTFGTVRTMSASRRFPTSRFQPGIAAMYDCTGASPSAFAICGLPPERRTTFALVFGFIALQVLLFLRRRSIQGHRSLDERLERARVDVLP